MRGRARRTAAIVEMNFIAGVVLMTSKFQVGCILQSVQSSSLYLWRLCFHLLVSMKSSAINRIRVFEIDDKKDVFHAASNLFNADGRGYVEGSGSLVRRSNIL